jgi:UDP-glucuronate 4-epimerase
LAAQAGVRYSLENPTAYINSNIIGTFNLLEILKETEIKHFLFSSTSSVYGSNDSLPFKENDLSVNQLSIYSSTKKSCESLIHSYSYSYKIPSTIFRFFTAYGPWGRPDMAMFIFTKAILEDKKINIYNHGEMARDFTYINDLIESIFRLSNKIPNLEDSFKNDSLSNVAPYRIVNIGNSKKIKLMNMIEALERKLNKKSKKIFLPMQIGDVKETQADISLLKELTSYHPKTSIEEGVSKFIDWYLKYYQI